MDYTCMLTNTHEEVIKGRAIVKNLEQLYIAIVDRETRNIEVRNDFFDMYFTDTGFQEFKENSNKLNPYITFTFDETYTSHYNKMALELKAIKDYDDIVNYFLKHKKKAVNLLHHLCNHYETSYNEALSANNKLSTVHLELLESQNQASNNEIKYDRLKERHELMSERFDSLVRRINFQYERDISPEKMKGIDIEINNYKKILYIKEITRVHYVDTFIFFLQEIMKTLHNLPTRLLVIGEPYAYQKAYMYPGCKPHTDLSYNDIFSSDIYMAGFQQKIVEAILHNPSKIDYLVILDRSGHATPYVEGKDVENLFTISDLKDLTFSVDNSRLITYRDDTLYVPYIDGYDDLSLKEKLSKYSSTTIMRAVIQLLER